MEDRNGQKVRIGDRVELWSHHFGKVVCSFDDADYSAEYPKSEWAHLTSGALIEMENGTLFHYIEADEDFRIVREQRVDRKKA